MGNRLLTAHFRAVVQNNFQGIVVIRHLVKPEYIEHILNAKSINQAATEEFIEVTLNERSISFWVNVKKMNLNTFQSGNKILEIKSLNQQ